MTELAFERVTIDYRTSGARGTIRAVEDMDLTLPSGGTLGIAGESGSGKSTLILAALRLLPRHAELGGRVLLGGQDIAELGFGQIRAVRWAEASIVFQGALHSLNPVRTVGQQIVEALELHRSEAWSTPQARTARMRTLLDQVDLDADLAESYPHQLSGGQKQRIMIAMALACEPQVLIADEPTTALDVIVQQQVLDLLSGLVAERGISLLMISHDLSVLASVCERIAVMRSGRLVEIGPAEQICAAGAEEYTRTLADAFPTIGDPASRLAPETRNPARIWREPPFERTEEVVLDAAGLQVSFAARGRMVQAVDSVDLALHRSEILAVVGQSGSGKTTLARALLGLQDPDPGGGAVRFHGAELGRRARDQRAFRRRVQMILQDPTGSLNPKLTVYESVAEGLRIQGHRGDERAAVIAALEAAELAPAEDYLGALPQELSGGQRQRVVIAGALALDPEVLLADEPVASLDASVRGEILSLFLALRKNVGASILVITHDLGLAWNIADRVAVMRAGRIVEQGDVETVLTNPQHEYTRALLDAVPSFRTERAHRIGETEA